MFAENAHVQQSKTWAIPPMKYTEHGALIISIERLSKRRLMDQSRIIQNSSVFIKDMHQAKNIDNCIVE
jgi:hypothetical protein